MSGATIATGFASLTAALLLVLTVVWVRKYRQFRTPLVLGLVAFCAVLLVENAVALYFYFFTMERLYVADPTIANLVVVMRGLQFAAVAFFTYSTFD